MSSKLLTAITILFVALCPLVSGSKRNACKEAYLGCNFAFLGARGLSRFTLLVPGVPFTPQIVFKDPRVTIGVVSSNHVASELIFDNGEAHPITSFGKHPFVKDLFKPLIIHKTKSSGISFQSLHGKPDNHKILDGQCVRVHFTHVQVLKGGHLPKIQNVVVHPEDGKRNCVVFLIRVPPPAKGHPAPGHHAPGHPAPDHHVPDHHAPGHPAPGHPALGHPAPGHPAPGHPALDHPALDHPALDHPAPGHPVPGHPVPGHPVPGHPALDHPAPGHPAPGHPALDHPAPGHPVPGKPGLAVPFGAFP